MDKDIFEEILKIVLNVLIYFRDNLLALAAITISIISLWITWLKNVKDRNNSGDKELIEQLKLSLELAYNSIATNNNGPPTNNRLRWLTAARHISRYRDLQSSLKTILHKTICEEHEEYWRNKFYELLSRIDTADFFSCVADMEIENIDLRSAAVVYSFSVWKEGRQDPLDNITLEDIILKYELYRTSQNNFWNYVKKKSPSLAQKVENRIPKQP